MKKTYNKPFINVVNIRMQQHLLNASQSYDLGSASSADDDTKNGGWNSRGGGLWDDDDF